LLYCKYGKHTGCDYFELALLLIQKIKYQKMVG